MYLELIEAPSTPYGAIAFASVPWRLPIHVTVADERLRERVLRSQHEFYRKHGFEPRTRLICETIGNYILDSLG